MADIREQVQQVYGKVAEQKAQSSCCAPSCCGPISDEERISAQLGYSVDEMSSVPDGANLGLGCGNPQAIASLKTGERVLDLGSGAGFDAFLAANQVGPSGQVIGVDMTPQMLQRARQNAIDNNYFNVEFRRGHIEELPVRDDSVDVILSNCVINLSPDKGAVFREAFRVLKPGGRLAISDVVARGEIPQKVKEDMLLVSQCVGGAEPVELIQSLLEQAGFQDIRIAPKDESAEFISKWADGEDMSELVVSATIEAVKPSGCC